MQRFVFAVIAAFAFFAYVHGETTCENHRRNSRNSAHGLSWNITCNEAGEYDPPLQCTSEAQEKKRWCACYDKEKEEAVTQPSRKMRHCNCPLKADKARDDSPNSEPGCDDAHPQCSNTGKFEAKQCCASSGKCRCVDPSTGEQRTEPTRDENLHCPDH